MERDISVLKKIVKLRLTLPKRKLRLLPCCNIPAVQGNSIFLRINADVKPRSGRHLLVELNLDLVLHASKAGRPVVAAREFRESIPENCAPDLPSR
jgi:hypothetical protein